MLTQIRIVLLCAAAALLVSLPTLRNGFAIDDVYVFIDQPATHSLRNVPRFFAGGWGMGSTNAQERALNTRYYRPLPTTLGALEYALFGLHPAGYHATSAFLHAATAVFLALLLWQLTSGAAVATLLGGLLFAIHPVQCEAFCAACYQTTLLAGLFTVLTLLVFARVFERGPRLGLLCALALCLLSALLSKEEAFAVPLLIVAWAAILRPPAWWRALRPSLLAMLVPLGVVLVLRHSFLVPSKITYFADESASVVALTMVRVVALYGELLLAPLRLCPFYDWFIIGYETGLSFLVATGAAILCASGLVFVYCLRRAPLISLALAWFLLGLAPVSQIVPIIVVAADRFLYLPMMGWALLVGCVLDLAWQWARTVGRTRLVAAAILLLFTTYVARTFARLPDWQSDETLNLATAAAFPETPTPFLNLASYYERFERNPAKAFQALEEAQRRAPGWRPALERARALQVTAPQGK
jgi:protein O-mannosyl-transferase